MDQSRRSWWQYAFLAVVLCLVGLTAADQPMPVAPRPSAGLDEVVQVKLEKVFLADAVQQLAELSGVVIGWDPKVDGDIKNSPESLQATGLRAGTILGELLNRHSLTMRRENDSFTIFPSADPHSARLGESFPQPSQAEARILKALDELSTVEFDETPLQEALQHLFQERDVNLVGDANALTPMIRESKVTLTMKDARLSSILKTLLREYDLTYIIDEDALRITSPLIAGSQFLVRTYPVGDLVTAPDELKSLMQSVEKTVDLATWERQGGQGNIAAANNSKSLIVSQTWHGHQKILELIRVLRQAKSVR